jgi:hypothetical protein
MSPMPKVSEQKKHAKSEKQHHYKNTSQFIVLYYTKIDIFYNGTAFKI